MKMNSKIWKIVAVAFLTMMLLPAIVSAKMDVQTYQQEDSVKFVIKNTGEKPAYVFNALKILDDKGNEVYASQEPSSAEVLKINPGVSYTFEWNTDDVSEGRFRGILYEGDDKRTLKAIPTDIVIRSRPGKPKFYTDKMFYKNGESVDVTFRNMGLGTIYVNVNNWKITSLDTERVVDTLSEDCGFGYGYGCADSFEPLGFLKQVKQTWDQKDSSGDQVSPGNYMVTAEYENKQSGNVNTISTKKFIIRPPRKDRQE
ncbi:Uncharacterised protein [uncultured archaeon]|nr:Uncharacterised protein [uncultured archaeon]